MFYTIKPAATYIQLWEELSCLGQDSAGLLRPVSHHPRVNLKLVEMQSQQRVYLAACCLGPTKEP